MLDAKLAQVKTSVPPVPTHKLSQLMEFVTTVLTLVILVELLLLFVLHVSKDLTLLVQLALLLALLELILLMEYANVWSDLFSLTNVLLNAQLDSELSEDSAQNALRTALVVQDLHQPAHLALMDMLSMLLLVFVKLPLHANSVNTFHNQTADAQEFALKILSTMNLFVLLLVFKDIKITELEDASPRTLRADAHSPTI
jgi:hypothetical protein